MAVLCPFRRSSMCRYVHRELTRNELLDLGSSQDSCFFEELRLTIQRL
jgi:hypothetical protein